MILTNKQIDDIIYFLQGSCKSLDEAIEAITDGEIGSQTAVTNEQELCDRLDNTIFCCDGCGWWCDIGEECGDRLCEDCS